MGYSYRLTARVLLYAPSHRQDNTYHTFCYTSRGALALKREIDQWAHSMKDRSNDPSHHERTLLPRSYISLLFFEEGKQLVIFSSHNSLLMFYGLLNFYEIIFLLFNLFRHLLYIYIYATVRFEFFFVFDMTINAEDICFFPFFFQLDFLVMYHYLVLVESSKKEYVSNSKDGLEQQPAFSRISTDLYLGGQDYRIPFNLPNLSHLVGLHFLFALT